jgi:hypothetical protein
MSIGASVVVKIESSTFGLFYAIEMQRDHTRSNSRDAEHAQTARESGPRPCR